MLNMIELLDGFAQLNGAKCIKIIRHLSNKAARCPLRSTDLGLTLPELLVASLLGLFMIVIGLTVSQNALQTNYRLLTAQQLRDNWNKISLLLNADISESCSAVGSGSSLTLRVLPTPESASNLCSSSTTGSTITYSLTGSSFSRTGPRVRRDGSLSSGGTTGAFLASTTGTLSTDVSSFTVLPAGSSQYAPKYQLTLSKNGVTYSGNNSSSSFASRPRVRSFD